MDQAWAIDGIRLPETANNLAFMHVANGDLLALDLAPEANGRLEPARRGGCCSPPLARL